MGTGLGTGTVGAQLEIGGGSKSGSTAGSRKGLLPKLPGGRRRIFVRRRQVSSQRYRTRWVFFALYLIDESNERAFLDYTYTLVSQLGRVFFLFCLYSRRLYFEKSMSSSIFFII